MTAEEIIDGLKTAIKEELGFETFVLPQTAKNSTAHIEIQYQDIAENGNGGEKLIFFAEYKTCGTHFKWLTQTIELKRKIIALSSEYMNVLVGNIPLRAYWFSRGNAGWIYPSDDDGSMCAEYYIPYRIEIDLPSRLLQ